MEKLDGKFVANQQAIAEVIIRNGGYSPHNITGNDAAKQKYLF